MDRLLVFFKKKSPFACVCAKIVVPLPDFWCCCLEDKIGNLINDFNYIPLRQYCLWQRGI